MDKIDARRISLLIIIIGPLLLFGRMLLSGQVLFWGTPMLQFVPWHRYALETLRAGHVPIWNPLLGAGAPLLANLQSALLYPPNLLLLFLGPEHGHGYLVVLHLVFAGLGMARLSRKLGTNLFGQVTAGLAFSLGGYMVARAWFISINHAAAWLPWIILAADALCDQMASRGGFRRSLPAILALTLALAMQWLAGHAQTAWYSGLMLIAWIVWRMRGDVRKTTVLWIGSRLVIIGVLAFAIAAAQLLPTLEYLSLSPRAGELDRQFALTYSFWPWRILGLIFPGLFGNPAIGDFWGYGNYWEDAIYIGLMPLIFSLGSIWKGLRRWETTFALERFLLLVSGLSLMLALGKNTPVFPFLFDHVPSFNLFQAPARWNLLLVFSLAILAGRGADRWKTPEGRGLYWTRLLTAGAGIIAIASYLGLQWIPNLQASFFRSFVVSGIILTICGLLTLFFPKQHRRLAILMVGGFILTDLLLAGQGLNPTISPEVFEGNVLGAKGIVGRIYMPGDLEQRLKFEQTHRFDTFDPGVDWAEIREIGLPNTNMLDNVASLNNFDPLVTSRFATFLTALEGMPTTDQDRFLAWMDVAYRIDADPEDPQGVVFKPLVPEGRLHVLSEAIAASSAEEALDLVTAAEFDYSSQVVLEGPASTLFETNGSGAILAYHDEGPDAISISVDMVDDGWLVLADAWYPGWEATIDGEQTEIFRANYLFKGIAIPAGIHDVLIRYHPVSFITGGAISLVSIFAFVVLGTVCSRRD